MTDTGAMDRKERIEKKQQVSLEETRARGEFTTVNYITREF